MISNQLPLITRQCCGAKSPAWLCFDLKGCRQSELCTS